MLSYLSVYFLFFTLALPVPSVCSVRLSRRSLLRQNDNISPFFSTIYLRVIGRTWFVFGGSCRDFTADRSWQAEGKVQRLHICFVAVGAVTSLFLRETAGLQSEQNMFANYFTAVIQRAFSRNVGLIRRVRSMGKDFSLDCGWCGLCVSLQSNLFKPLTANTQTRSVLIL